MSCAGLRVCCVVGACISNEVTLVWCGSLAVRLSLPALHEQSQPEQYQGMVFPGTRLQKRHWMGIYVYTGLSCVCVCVGISINNREDPGKESKSED